MLLVIDNGTCFAGVIPFLSVHILGGWSFRDLIQVSRTSICKITDHTRHFMVVFLLDIIALALWRDYIEVFMSTSLCQ